MREKAFEFRVEFSENGARVKYKQSTHSLNKNSDHTSSGRSNQKF